MELKNKRWNFTFATAAGVTEDGYSYAADWGWNSVMAKTKKTAIKKATKWCAENGRKCSINGKSEYTLEVGSVNCDENTEKMLLSNFY